VTELNPVVRFAEPSDAPGLVRLFSRYYTQNKPEAYFLWQFFSPEMPAKLVVVVEAEEIVGSFGLMLRPLSQGLRCAQAMDMLLAETHRGHGLFFFFFRHALVAFRDIHYLVVLANRSGMDAVTRSLGWSVIAQVPVYTALKIPLCGAISDPELAGGQDVDDTLRIIYDRRTEHWRFDDHPVNQYHCLEVSGVRGYLKVFSTPAEAANRIGDILYVTPADQTATERWLQQAFEWFRQNEVWSCGLWALPDTVMAASAVRAGLVPQLQDRWLCVTSVGSERPEMRWDVCAADAEFY